MTFDNLHLIVCCGGQLSHVNCQLLLTAYSLRTRHMNDMDQVQKSALQAITEAKDLAGLEKAKVQYLGRKGQVAGLFAEMSRLSEEERKVFGEKVNALKQTIEQAVADRRNELQQKSYADLDQTEWVDVTQPGTQVSEGHLHLVTHAIREITHIFERIGFDRVRYPEVDWDWYAFESLNMPKDHPARDEWETFFIDRPEDSKYGKTVLTPHTSNGQVREMEKGKLPIRMINISKCYRRQSDVSHSPMFHQFEGMYIDDQVTVGHLKGVFDYFVHQFFGVDRQTRIRPSHFRFTEPSVELDISCGVCGGTGRLSGGEKCRLCKLGWLELGGGGMINNNVLRSGKIDPTKYSGFAFGWGVERTMMMKSGLKIDDIRILYKNDLRFLQQF